MGERDGVKALKVNKPGSFLQREALKGRLGEEDARYGSSDVGESPKLLPDVRHLVLKFYF